MCCSCTNRSPYQTMVGRMVSRDMTPSAALLRAARREAQDESRARLDQPPYSLATPEVPK